MNIGSPEGVNTLSGWGDTGQVIAKGYKLCPTKDPTEVSYTDLIFLFFFKYLTSHILYSFVTRNLFVFALIQPSTNAG